MNQLIRSRNALMFIAAGLYLALGTIAGFTTVNAVLLLALGIDRFRWDRSRWSVVLIAVSAFLLLVHQLSFFVLLILLSLGVYYWKVRHTQAGPFFSKHQLFLNLRLEEQSWILRSMGYWHLLGEARLDLSQAVPEESETTIVLQGLLGNVDLIVPDDYGLEIDARVLVGQIGTPWRQEGGMMQRVQWRSPDYEAKELRLKLQLFYLVGDIKIRPM